MRQRDDRYEIIKPMLKEGKIESFLDIFKFIPKSIVAKDLGKKIDKFSFLMDHIEKFTYEDTFTLARFCDISVPQMLKLVEAEYFKNKDKIAKSETRNS